ncbi:MAG: polysaccharide deacetylase family protein, partial [Vicinamibacterales bacterium]
TLLADLRVASEIRSATYDCIVLTQTLHVIDDMPAALRECHRILKPGGVLLATFPSASRVCLEYGEDGDYWRMTPAGARALVRSSFEPSILSSQPYGNVLTNTAFLHGLSATELSDTEFDDHDPYFPVLTGIRAKKTRAASRPGARGVILLYHRIDATLDVHGLGVPPEMFEAHLQCLGSDYQVLALDDLLSTRVEDLPERAVALTFDDGYEDNLTVAAPLLQRYRMPATFFLTTCGVASTVEYWWDTLERLLLDSLTPETLDMQPAGIPLISQTATPEQRQVAHWRLYEMLVHASLDERTRVMQRLKEWAAAGTPRVRPIVADEVLQLAKLPGVTIGGHTVNHVALPDNPDSRLLEMSDCRAQLKRITGRPVELFAYPYGAVDRQTAAEARRAWRWGMSCEERSLGDAFDAARVPRLDVKATSRDEFGSRLSRLFEPPTISRGV